MDISEQMTADANVRNNLDGLFNEDWLYENGYDELYERFAEEFAEWLEGQGVDCHSYKNMKLDLAYYLSDYVSSKEYGGSALEEIYEKVGE